MGQIQRHQPVLLLLAVISRHERALEWSRQQASERWGTVVLESEQFSFSSTNFYDATMGSNLKKTFLAFERLIDPSQLVAIKQLTNQWESTYAERAAHVEPRPLNLDPGYITEAKLVLATTKDRDHRIYLDRGIYAEVTLYYQQGQWQARPWTYPDYRRGDYHQFFLRCRDYLRSNLRSCERVS